ncbi:MAG: tetratricopeptide repeat protein [Solirubrobacterales bacterium]
MLVRILTALALAAVTAAPARADKRLDEAVAKAEAQLAKGKEAEAIKILQKAAAQASKDPEAQIALGQFMETLGKLDEAGAAFGRAGELATGAPAGARARTQARRSAFALRAGTAKDALAFARLAVDAEPAGVDALAALARAEARLGDPAARSTAERAVQAGSGSAAAHLARGDALLAAHLPAEAEGAYRRARELRPKSALAATALAEALAARGIAPAALEAAREAAQLDKFSGEAVAALGLATLAQDPLDKNSEAVAAVQQASILEPKNPLIKMFVGQVYTSRGQLPEAGAAYDEAARLDPSWPAPRVAALELYLRQGGADQALAGLQALPEEMKTSADAQLLLGRLLLRKEDWSGAKAALNRAVAALPGDAEAQAAHGDAAYAVGDLKLAADAYGRAVSLQPGNAAYRSSYGLFLAYDGRLDEAVTVLRELTGKPEGQTPGAFIALGWTYRRFKPARVAEAVAAYGEALKLDPKSGPAALGVAQSYRAGQQWARAITAYERVATMGPKLEGESLVGTAWCYLRSGDDYKARFFTGLAAKAGADVRAIRAVFSSPPSPGRAEDEWADLREQLRSKNAGEQVRAVRDFLAMGKPAVATLNQALTQPGTSPAAREAIKAGLAKTRGN